MRVSAKIFAATAVVLLMARAAQAQCGPPDESFPAVRESLLVSTEWLAAHLRDPNLVILEVEHMRGPQAPAELIPGSRPVDAMAFTVDNFDLPPVAVLDSLVEALGISNTSRVVLYGDPWVTGWMYVVLDYLGHGDRTAMLNGGLTQWRAESRPLGAPQTRVARASFTPHPRPEIIADAAWLRSHLRDTGLAVLDVRSPGEYTGESRGHGTARDGHIPGARSFVWSTAYERPADAEAARDTRLLPPAQLQTLLRHAGLVPGSQPVTYCAVGMRASQSYFLLKYLGFTPKFYDGSWTDWSRRSELPIATGTARGTP